MTKPLLRFVVGCLLPVAVATTQAPPRVDVEARTFTTKGGAEIAYDVGTLFVPENRDDPDSRTIGVGFARIRADARAPATPPIFHLPGGPGGSYVTPLESKSPRRLERALLGFGQFRHFTDIVLVDQRGFSDRGDRFEVDMPLPVRRATEPLTLDEEVAQFTAWARETVDEFGETDVDLAGYTVKQCAHDVADLTRALGYDEITLYGTSFGSQWSFAVMRLHPEIVARALLSGVEPLNHGYDMPSYVFAAVQRMWRSVDADPRFERFLPPGGMAEAARTVIERLERAPLEVRAPGPSGAEQATVAVIGPDDLPWFDPAQILELYHGHTARWALQNAWRSVAGSRRRPLIGPLIDTSLGVTPERRHRLWTDPATRYVRRRNFARYLATADIWPSPDVGDEFRTPELCDIPVVFAQGTWDVQTPLENTFEIAPFFVKSRVLIAERGGHGVFDPIAAQRPEVWASLVRFLETGAMHDIPARVQLEPAQRFALPTFRPPKRR